MSGNFFENYVIVEIIKSYYNSGELRPPVYFYRDKEKREIDLIIEQNGKLYPIKIKKTSKPSKDMIENFKVLETIGDTSEGQCQQLKKERKKYKFLSFFVIIK